MTFLFRMVLGLLLMSGLAACAERRSDGMDGFAVANGIRKVLGSQADFINLSVIPLRAFSGMLANCLLLHIEGAR
jgi:hypothetical protein